MPSKQNGMPRMRKPRVNPPFILSPTYPAEESPKLFACQKPKLSPLSWYGSRFYTMRIYIFFYFSLSFFEELLRCEIVRERENHEFLRFRAVNASCVFKLFFRRKSQPGQAFFNTLIYDAISYAKTIFCDTTSENITVINIIVRLIFIAVATFQSFAYNF